LILCAGDFHYPHICEAAGNLPVVKCWVHGCESDELKFHKGHCEHCASDTQYEEGRLEALVTLAAGTGMRPGECFGLTVDRVRFLERTAMVDRQLVTVQGQAPCLGPPKTRASNRTIPLPQVVVDALAAHLAEFPAAPDGLVFTLTGKPITRQAFGHKWRAAVETARLPAGTGFHALRHYYASLLIRHGESVKTVQARLGHASAVETLDTYSHLWPDSDDRTRDAIDSVVGAKSTADALRTESSPD
jgi:integrase